MDDSTPDSPFGASFRLPEAVHRANVPVAALAQEPLRGPLTAAGKRKDRRDHHSPDQHGRGDVPSGGQAHREYKGTSIRL
jgi:hypothetical protein